MTGHSITLEGIRCAYGSKVVIDDLDLGIAPGEFVAFIGPSGCGKTTTLRVIAGLEQPTDGRVLINGADVTYAKPWDRETPMVWQNFALFPYLSVEENVAFGLKRRGLGRAEVATRVAEALDLVGIGDLAKRRIAQLSGGQKQRTGIARALVLRPKVLLLDEPLSALDANLRMRLQDELRTLHRKLGVTFVYVTHYQNEAFSLADRVIVMNGGRVEQIGTPVQISRRPASRFVAEFVGINNVVDATVLRHEADRTVVAAPFGDWAVPPVDRAPGTPIEFVVAADAIEFAPADSDEGDVLVGEIAGIDVSDTLATILVRAEGGTELRMQKPFRQVVGLDLEVGHKVGLRWPIEEHHIL